VNDNEPVSPITPGRRARVEAMLSRRLGSVVAVAESVRRRHNASAILRTCEAFGVHEVHLVTAGFRPSPGAARGAERWVHRRRFDTTTESLMDLKARGFKIYVADLLPGALTPETVPVDGPVALVFGSEVRGVSDEARALCDGAVMIPMVGLTGSLNVSVSAAILLRTVTERRRALVGADLSDAARTEFYDRWVHSETRAEFGRKARAEGIDPGDIDGVEPGEG
jgi:tRNA (guanosine-2'-O-)-methyltransferase